MNGFKVSLERIDLNQNYLYDSSIFNQELLDFLWKLNQTFRFGITANMWTLFRRRSVDTIEMECEKRDTKPMIIQ